MARTDTVTIAANTWTQLTNANTTAVTFQVKRGTVEMVATFGETPPADFDNALTYRAPQGEMLVPLAELAPGTAGANRLYAYSQGEAATIYISHADA
jgi:hypothetical protein